MKVVETLPHDVREIENLWIPLSDGCRLAARIWLPASAEDSPVPALLECIPYRKRDFTRARDEPMHRYFAGHGYAAVRVDIRGTGDSDGILQDEYTEQELEDTVETIRWIASQPWCDGGVGMMGISWGGFNSLQVAALRPPELRAIITLCSTDDRYADDAHYMGGCLLNENLIWGSVLMAYNAYPPDPEIVGSRWRKMWLERLEQARHFPELWLRHQRRDAYWRHGSVCEDYAAIRCPVYAIGGWADGYSNAVPRLLAGLRVPCKGLVGPWAHCFPHDATPGPEIGFLQEAVRWWDHWLKGIDTGLMDEPRYRVWMQESVPPRTQYAERPGRWVAEASWPSPRIGTLRLALAPGRLEREPQPDAELVWRSPQTVGLAGGDWCGFGVEGEAPGDQREDDGKSLSFDSDPLEQRMEILGAPELCLELEVDRPWALLAVRLDDVAPDGASTRVSYGLLNLGHRLGHDRPLPLEPGRRTRVRVRLNDAAHAFPQGHVLRVAVSTGYWPIAWPSPEPFTLRVFTGASELALPVRPPSEDDARLRSFPPPEAAPGLEQKLLGAAHFQRTIERHVATRRVVYTIASDGGELGGAALARVPAIDLEVGNAVTRRFEIHEGDPLSARAQISHSTLLRRRDWSTRIEVRTSCESTRDAFLLRGSLEAYEGAERVFERRWDERVERDGL